MASKQFGKLRQWAGEVISTREKAQTSSEFAALERDMETRKKGLDKIYTALRDYVEYISQKQPSEAVPGDAIMQSEALGVVLIEHGEDLGDSSALGRSIASFGRARCQIATIQNIYAVTIAESFLTYLDRSKAELEEYAAQRKKLESRRLAYDAAIAKSEKTYKKEKDKKDAEEELARARARYDEMAEDVRVRMDAIREGEVEHQRELRQFLRSEIKYVEQYLEVLREVETEWPEPDTYADLRRPMSSFSTPHDFGRISTRSTDSRDSDAKQPPPVPSRFGSHRSNRSTRSTSSKKSGYAVNGDQHESSSESEKEIDAARSRASSLLSRRRSTKSSRTASRRHSRSGSVSTAGNGATADITDETTSVKSDGKHRKVASGSVASWVGDAMSSVMSRSKSSRHPDVENFAALDDEDNNGAGKNGVLPRHIRRSSIHSTKSDRSANARNRSLTRADGKNMRKIMKATYDFSGSNDELSFKAGEEIIVINEVLDDWWLGETGGRRGLFPSNYAMLVRTVDVPAASKFKNASNSSILGLGRSGKISPEDQEIRRTLVEPSESELSMTEDEHDRESMDDSHPFSDDRRSVRPSGATIPVAGNTYITTDDTFRGRSFVGEDEFDTRLSSSLGQLNVDPNPGYSPKTDDQSCALPVKKIPPPPPPRRALSNAAQNGPPPLPFRSVVPSRTHSSNAALHSLGPPMMDRRAHSDTSSPFESQSELSIDAVATTKVNDASAVPCLSCTCEYFVEDPFRGHGLCANCTHAHA